MLTGFGHVLQDCRWELRRGIVLLASPVLGWGRVHGAQAASRAVREEYGRAVPWADLLHLCRQQPVPESTRRPQAGTMEAPSRTPASPTRRVQTIIQVSAQRHGTSALQETLREPGQPDGSPNPPQLPHPNPVTGSVAKPIALSGWQLGSS